ncbi:FAD-dependent oxidoreductase [Halobacillus sp. K22]|uniref:FAD-dependent oxidoreductase n=1 Tax=Halobacillus sp. K22 TaxID=3457431 RepID=UPI003FCC2A41
MSKRLLLVGAGHAHLEVIRRLKSEAWSNVEVCLISSSRYQYYSGMFSGFTEGLYTLEETRVSLEKVTREARIHFIEKTAVSLRPKQKKVICHDGSVYPFDVVSFDIGSQSLPKDFEDTVARTIKPNYQFISQIEEIRNTTHPLIVGGGAAGTELALSIQTYKEKNQIPGQVKLVTAEKVMNEFPKLVSTRLKSLLTKKGVQVWEDESVKEIHENYIVTDSGNKIRHTSVLWLGGASAEPIFKHSGVEVDERGFALVRDTLQFQEYDYIFGSGDCVTLAEYPELQKSGVYAVKQGPVLWNNLSQYLSGQPLQEYDPQKNALYILSTGKEQGFMVYGPLSHHSHQAWKLKNKIDRDFMAKYK